MSLRCITSLCCKKQQSSSSKRTDRRGCRLFDYSIVVQFLTFSNYFTVLLFCVLFFVICYANDGRYRHTVYVLPTIAVIRQGIDFFYRRECCEEKYNRAFGHDCRSSGIAKKSTIVPSGTIVGERSPYKKVEIEVMIEC